MSRNSAIVVVVDRLGAGYLGPYGNTWLETPAFNRLASQSMLFENALVDCPTLEAFYQSLADGSHCFARLSEKSGPLRPPLAARMSERGIATWLVGDEPAIFQLPMAATFAQRIAIPARDQARTAASIEATQMARLFAAALETVEQLQSPFFLLLHVQGLAGAWDAPREFRERFADEEDPAPPELVEPPDRMLSRDFDPDEILGILHALAGQVVLLDLCFETLLTSLEESNNSDNVMILVTSPRGFSVGEHGAVGASGDGLHEEVMHVPLMIRLPDHRFATRRFQTLVYPPDISTTLAGWFDLPEEQGTLLGRNLLTLGEPETSWSRQCVVSAFGTQRSMRTPAWFLRHDTAGAPQLYAKPYDRWEVNEVANRCGETLERGMQALAAYEKLSIAGRLNEFPDLPQDLLDSAE